MTTMNDIAEKAFLDASYSKEKSVANLVVKFASLCNMIQKGNLEGEAALINAFQETMSEADEVSLQAQNAVYSQYAQIQDVIRRKEIVEQMRAKIKSIEEELAALLNEKEIRAEVASVTALPTKESLIAAYERDMEKSLKPIELETQMVAKKVAMHRKHLAVLWASIQQLEIEMQREHDYS